jgi:hypothetical protein
MGSNPLAWHASMVGALAPSSTRASSQLEAKLNWLVVI